MQKWFSVFSIGGDKDTPDVVLVQSIRHCWIVKRWLHFGRQLSTSNIPRSICGSYQQQGKSQATSPLEKERLLLKQCASAWFGRWMYHSRSGFLSSTHRKIHSSIYGKEHHKLVFSSTQVYLTAHLKYVSQKLKPFFKRLSTYYNVYQK